MGKIGNWWDLSRRLAPFCCLVAAVAFTLARVIAFADTQKPMSAKAKMGDALFHQHCIVCHNKQPGDTTPFGPPNLHGILRGKSSTGTTITPEQARAIIKQGHAPMPAFAHVLSDSQISALIAYLKTQ